VNQPSGVVHVKLAPENLEWLRKEARESGLSQVKLVNILIEFARNSGMQIRPDVKPVPG
jgi:hypothetical protein